MHKHQCSSLAVSEDARFLLTAGHSTIKVWDYKMQLDVNSQVDLNTESLLLINNFALPPSP